MDEETKKSALDKVRVMKSIIAYPDELLDDSKLEDRYKGLEIMSNDYWENIRNSTRFYKKEYLSRLRKPVNKRDWIEDGESAAEVNAFYDWHKNIIGRSLLIYYITIVSINNLYQ